MLADFVFKRISQVCQVIKSTYARINHDAFELCFVLVGKSSWRCCKQIVVYAPDPSCVVYCLYDVAHFNVAVAIFVLVITVSVIVVASGGGAIVVTAVVSAISASSVHLSMHARL